MRLIITGDVSPTAQVMPFFEQGDMDTLFGAVPSAFEGADRVIVNLECALTTADTPIRKIGPNLKASPACARVLRAIGVTDCALSNNHILDYGDQGLEDTLRHLDACGLRYTGVGADDTASRAPHRMEIGSRVVTLIAVCEHEYTFALPGRMGANPYDPYDTMADIRAAKADSDVVIVFYHGGKEYAAYPSPRLRKLCRAMAENGADVVLCQHSHCIGCYERYEGAHLLYGQGNFHFVHPSEEEGWYTGLIVQLDIEGTCEIGFVPVRMLPHGIDLIAEPERAAVMAAFAARNEALASGAWQAGWADFCRRKTPAYEAVVQNAFGTVQQREQFASYLQCEAHLDVWMQMFQTWHQKGE